MGSHPERPTIPARGRSYEYPASIAIAHPPNQHEIPENITLRETSHDDSFRGDSRVDFLLDQFMYSLDRFFHSIFILSSVYITKIIDIKPSRHSVAVVQCDRNSWRIRKDPL